MRGSLTLLLALSASYTTVTALPKPRIQPRDDAGISTFSMDSLLLLQQGHFIKMALNIILNVMVCIFMAWLGLQLVMQKG